jgi:hypothetical protein
MQQTYKFNKADFDENGLNKIDENLILDFINNCEKDFHKRFYPLVASNICANSFTMDSIKNCFFIAENEGIERYGEIDFYETPIIYAIKESQFNENLHEPIIYVLDNTIKDGIVILKYIPPADTQNIQS